MKLDRIRFNFTQQNKENYTQVKANAQGQAPLYSDQIGYGFLKETLRDVTRELSPNRIVITEEGFWITESEDTIRFENVNQYNYGGMVFRAKVPSPGTYGIQVTLASEPENTAVAVSGMQADRLLSPNVWDAAELVIRNNKAFWTDKTWEYDYVTGNDYIDIEVEPLLEQGKEKSSLPATVGISEIVITKLSLNHRMPEEKPTIFTLGDSTVKTYIFEEAGMSGWGQIFDDLFDLEKVNVINYSMGGRSFKSMYCEGRFNEVLVMGKAGDYILLQSGHNDESVGEENGPQVRFGRGSTAKSYEEWIRRIYIPAIQSRGIIPILVTPMTRIDSEKTNDTIVLNGFKHSNSPGIDFPRIMKTVGKDMGITILDLYEESIKYLEEIGGIAASSMFLSFEAGETPSKTNSGSYANGNPSGSSDGTHFKETLAKQWARIVVTEMWKNKVPTAEYLKSNVIEAIRSSNWENVYTEVPKDTQVGANAYYRNQIEKMVQLGAMYKDMEGYFYPKEDMKVQEFIHGLEVLWKIDLKPIAGSYMEEILTREVMAAIIIDAYKLKFGKDREGNYKKPKYMTDYNGVNLTPDNPNYDSNLVGESAQYYPLIGWGRITDKDEIDKKYIQKVQEAYTLGLVRSEKGILRGKMINGTEMEPKVKVTREKAAKALYFLWVLAHNIKEENDK